MDSARVSPKKPLFLLIDKENQLAASLSEHLAKNATIVVVSKDVVNSEKDIVHVPYLPPLPQIPDGNYRVILFVWNEKEEHLFEPLLQKAHILGARMYVLVLDDEKHTLPENTQDACMLIIGNLFSQKKQFPLDEFLYNAKANKKVILPHMGLHNWYPVLFEDAVSKIAEEIESNTNEKRLFIGPAHQTTSLSIAHALQKVDPEITIDFSHQADQVKESGREKRAAFVQYSAIEKLQNVYKAIVVSGPRSVKEEGSVVFSKKNKKRKQGSLWFGYIGYILLVCVFLPLFVALSSGGIGLFLFANAMQGIQNGNFALVDQEMKAAGKNFALADASLMVFSQEAGLIGQEHIVAVFQQKIKFIEKIAQAAENGEIAVQSLKDVLQGKTLSPQADVDTAVANMKQAQNAIQEISLDDIPASYKQDFLAVKNILVITSGVVDELPRILGVSGDKSYLLLFQNNMELRPGGGFIGSYGLLHLHNGAIKDFTIHDVYDADGQLAGHVEPPFAIRRYIPLVHLYLRDSNFDPDFTQDGQIAAHMFSLETGEQVDGVASIDLTVMKSMLQSVGSVYVPSFNQTVTSDNFFTLTEAHAEKNFFPGSTQKKDFLRAFAAALLQKIQVEKSMRISVFLNQVASLIAGKHMLVSFSNGLIQQAFTVNGLSNSLLDQRKNSSTTFNDFLGIVEANLGVNKVNAFVSREVKHSVDVATNGDVHERVALTLTNTSDGSWPGGSYVNYIRFLLPKGAVLTGISLNNVEQNIIPAITDPKIYEAKGFAAPKGLEVEHAAEAGKEVYGFLIRINPKSSMSIEISYTISHAFSLTTQKQTYSLLIWKQAGIDGYPYQLAMQLPDSLQFLGGSIPVASHSSNVGYQTEVGRDTQITTTFTKK